MKPPPCGPKLSGHGRFARLVVSPIYCALAALAFASAPGETPLRSAEVEIEGELKLWHRVTLTLRGPQSAETADPNPFLDYRLEATFENGDRRVRVPGFFAADGRAAETGAEAGDRWRVHFVPDRLGRWRWRISFRRGRDVALRRDPDAGEAVAPDGLEGDFEIAPSDKSGRDFRAHGLLRYTGERYFRFAGSGRYFLKGGADSPENFLAYAEFDGTAHGRHRYAAHARDWRPGDPTWRDGRGKGIIGALNYLASKGGNSVYFLTMNVGGDGKDVWPWTSPDERFRYDTSKLAQWEIVFSHMDRLGIHLHVVTQETENDQLLDGGALGRERKLYYRELIARFAHHLALTWNIGEENSNTDAQRKAFAAYIRALDPYDHPIAVHTFPNAKEKVYAPLLGDPNYEAASLQVADHDTVLEWVVRSRRAGRQWAVFYDEQGPARKGILPDADDPERKAVRRDVLWATLMAGGAGVEYYFGYDYPHNDLNCEDWRSRDRLWDLTRIALEFFERELPFARMEPMDRLVSGARAWCLARPGEIYAVYLPEGGEVRLELPDGEPYDVRWFDPRRGDTFREGSTPAVRGPGKVSLGTPPAPARGDWCAVVRRAR